MSVLIEKIEPIVVRQKLNTTWLCSQCEFGTRTICLVRITTSNGLVGWGEGYGPYEIIKAAIEFFTPFIIGMNALEHETIWNVMYRRSLDFARRSSFLAGLSAIDIALWDIKGKHFGLPICDLLGGKKTKLIKPYATGVYPSPGDESVDKLIKDATSFKNEGFKAVKMGVGMGLDIDERNVKAVRKAIGNDLDLMVDANHGYSLKEALELARRIEDQNIYFLEEPVSPEFYDQYAELRLRTSIPVAGGECEYLSHGFKTFLDKKCVDIIQPDIASTGGLTEVKRIANMAQIYGVQLIPHCWGTPIATHAAMHLVANLDPLPGRLNDPIPYMELDWTENAFRDYVIKPRIQLEDGYLKIPSKPGLGIEVDMDALQKFRIY